MKIILFLNLFKFLNQTVFEIYLFLIESCMKIILNCTIIIIIFFNIVIT